MKLEMSTYLAGIATAALAIAAGFGGGVLIANSVDTNGAVPAPGMSRIERTKREEPKAPIVETNAQASRSDEPTINPLAEAQPLRVNVETAEPAPVQPEAPKPLALQSEHPSSAIALPAATQTILSAGGNRRNPQRARSAGRAHIPDEPQARSQRKSKRDIARRNESGHGEQREIARYREGDARYVVRTENGRPADPTEVEQLKRALREQREGRMADNRALSYGADRRPVFRSIFGD